MDMVVDQGGNLYYSAPSVNAVFKIPNPRPIAAFSATTASTTTVSFNAA
jgi:hypothetical protein